MALILQTLNGLEMEQNDDLVTIKTLQSDSDLQIIHGYGDGGFRISGNRFNGSVVVTLRHTYSWTPPPPDNLTAKAFKEFLADNMPPLLLLDVGKAPHLPLQTLAEDLKQQGLALELMSTAAACRTWNVLISEGRNALAALYAVD